MYLNNKYTNWYMKLMNSRKQLPRKRKDGTCYESHHILPKSLGGSNHKSNLVLLTPREHFLAHCFLIRMTIGSQKKSMTYALVRFLGKNINGQRYKINSRIYQNIVENNRVFTSGKNNPMFNKPCWYKMSEEQKKQWKSNISKGTTGEKNPFYGKTHNEQIRKILSQKRSQPILVKFFDGTERYFTQYKFLGTYIGKSEALGCKLCKPQHENLLKKYGIKEIIKL